MMINGLSKNISLTYAISCVVAAVLITGCQAASLMNSGSDTSLVNPKLNGCSRLASIGYYRLDDETSIARLKRDYTDCIEYAKVLEKQGILIKQVDSVDSKFGYIK